MKFRNLRNIIGIILALGLFHTSCVEDSDKNGNQKPAPEGEAYLSLQVKTGDVSAFTRSGEELGSAEELAVHSVRVVLYDGNESEASKCKVEYVFEYNLETPGTWNNTGDATNWIADKSDGIGNGEYNDPYIIPSGNHLSPEARSGYEFATFAQRIKDKPYKMLVIINGQDDARSFNSEVYKATNKGNFLFNFNKAIAATFDPATGELTDGKGILMTNHQGLVEVTKDQLTKTADDAHKNPIMVSVDRMVAKVTVKHADNIQLPSGIVPGSETWALDITNKYTYWMRQQTVGESPSSTMEHLYAKDPNNDIFNAAIDKKNNFNTLYVDDNDFIYLPSNKVTNKFKEYEYTLENTIDTKSESFSAYSDQITRLIVGYKYIPTGYTGTENYYIYQNTIISQEEMNKYLTDLTYEIPGLTTFRAALNATNKTIYKLDGSVTHYFEVNGIRYCPQGQLYYTIPIQHFGGSEGDFGYYGVVRNNIYEITINSLTPPELAGPYMSADIHIQPWAQRSQGSTIGVTVKEEKWVPVKVYHWYHLDKTNLYQQWINTKLGINEDHEIYMGYVGQDLKVNSLSKATEFKADLAGYSAVFLTYSFPAISLTVSENADYNIVDLYYMQGFWSAGFAGFIDIGFIKEDGTILKIEGEYTDSSGNTIHITKNPGTTINRLTYVINDIEPTKGFVFLRNLVSLYNLKITDDSNKEYEIGPANACVKYYATNLPIIDNKVNWGSYGIQSPSAEPAHVATRSGDNISGIGNKGVGIVCYPKIP